MLRKLYWPAAATEFAVCALAAWAVLPYVYNTVACRAETPGVSLGLNYAVFAFAAIPAGLAALLALRLPAGERLRGVTLAWLPLLANAGVVARWALGAKSYFLEPVVFALSLAVSTAIAVALLSGRAAASELSADSAPAGKARGGRVALAVLLALAVAGAVQMFLMQRWFLSRLQFGWTDVGLNYMRVKNTAHGIGFLQETLARATFYDHFNLGLTVLVPFYRLYSHFSLIMWAQAAFLAAVAPAIYVYARGRGAGRAAAVLLGAAALVHPSMAKIAFSYSYGFHPVTLALPAVVLSIHFWEKRRWWLFVACAVFASTMEETLFPLYAGVGLVEALAPRGRRLAGAGLFVASAALFVIVTKVVMPAVAGQQYFQMVKFAHLGAGSLEIALSPFTKPAVFWGLLFSARSLTFLALILAPMAFLPLLAPRQLLYPVMVLLFVLLLDNKDLKTIDFWYQSLFLVTWMAAMAAGAARLGEWLAGRGRPRGALAAGAGALAAAACLAHFYGLLPWSRINMFLQLPRPPVVAAEDAEMRRFAATVPPTARVLATMRAATLFCDAASVSPLQDWQGSTDYDLVVLQRDDSWGQTGDQMRNALEAMRDSGAFRMTTVGDDFVILYRVVP